MNDDSKLDSKTLTPDAETTPVHRRSRTEFLLRWIGILATIGIVLFTIYKISLPDVDPNLVVPEIHKGPAESLENDQERNPGSLTAGLNAELIANAKHPLEPLLDLAHAAIDYIDQNVADYSAVVVKQARVNGKLNEEGYMLTMIRHERMEGETKVPFGVYTRFLKPKSLAGQEAIWVKGENDGKLVGHPAGMLNMKRLWLVPDGPIAMNGNLHPITRIGMKNLLVKMIETGEKDLAHDDCKVTITRNVLVDDHLCTQLTVTHEKKQDYFEYHIAKIYFDDKRQLPIAYEGFLWPENPGDDPPLLEKYFYTDIKTNIGLTDETFDPDNEDYNYPAW